MAEENTGLLVTIEARTAAFEKALARIEKKADSGFAAIKNSADKNMAAVEKTLERANAFEKRMSAIDRGFIGFGKSLIPSLGAITAALSVREVAAYADAWTSAKNSLAVAGITGRDQAKILDQLHDSAQRNATPIGALSDLFGKAAQASDNLGASQADLVRFSDGVALSLKVAGTSAGAASGGLTQLGQLLGSARVQAEEFNSVNESMRPVLIAVAAGLDKAGGSVNKLKQLVNDGEVSGRQFFEAFLKGLPSIEKMAANSSQTIEQGVTKISNAFMRYIGQTDESLSASQRLVTGLNALADNFDQTADVTLQLASVLAGALIGRSIAGMIATIPNAVAAMTALVTAMRAGTLTAAGIGAALGPLGLIAGAATAAYLAFGNWSHSIDDATRALASQAASADAVQGMIDSTAKAQDAYKAAIASTAGAQTTASNSIVADTQREFEAKKSLLELELKRQRALIAMQQASLAQQSEALKSEVGSKVFTRNSGVERGYSDPKVGDLVRLPDSITGLEKTQDVISKSPITAEIQKIRAEMELTEVGASRLEDALNSTFSSGSTNPAKTADTGTGKSKSGGGGSRLDEYQRLTQRVAEATAATLAETKAQAALNPTIEDFGFAANKARLEQELLAAALKAGKEVTPQLKAEISSLATGYAEAEAAAGRLSDTQEKAKDALNAQKDIAKGFLSDVRSALDDGKVTWEEWGNIAMNVLNKIIDKLQNQLVDALFSASNAAKGGGGGGGFLGQIFGSLFGGGQMAAVTGGAIGLFADGGWTGRGEKMKPAGFVHADEFVFTKKATQKAGVANLYRLMDYLEKGDGSSATGLGFADGGFTGMSFSPSIPSAASMISDSGKRATDQSSEGSNGGATVKIMLDKNLKAEILSQSAQQTVQILQSSADQIAGQGAAQAQKDFAQGKWDKVNASRYGNKAVVTQR